MSDFSGMEDLLQYFLQEASDLLSDVDNKLVDLEKDPEDHRLLNDIFRGFHTIKGGAGFLNATELVTLCHLTENLFDKLRNSEILLTPDLMDTIMAATHGVRNMFGELAQASQPRPADAEVIAALRSALEGGGGKKDKSASVDMTPDQAAADEMPVVSEPVSDGPNWNALHSALTDTSSTEAIVETGSREAEEADAPVAKIQPHYPPEGRRATDKPGAVASSAPSGRRVEEKAAARESTIRVDTARLDQVLNLSGEIGLTKNRLTSLRADILAGRNDTDTLHALDQAVSQLDLLVSDLQNSVMKTRMQPIGR